MALTRVARLGTKLVAVSSPRGETAWNAHRKDTHEMFEVIRESAAAMRSNVITMFTLVPSLNEPFACLGEKSRSSEVVVYPAETVKSFLTALQKYVAPYVRAGKGRLYEVFAREQCQGVQRKKGAKSENGITYNSSQATVDTGIGYGGYRGPTRAEAPRERDRGRGFPAERKRFWISLYWS